LDSASKNEISHENFVNYFAKQIAGTKNDRVASFFDALDFDGKHFGWTNNLKGNKSLDKKEMSEFMVNQLKISTPNRKVEEIDAEVEAVVDWVFENVDKNSDGKLVLLELQYATLSESTFANVFLALSKDLAVIVLEA
jgi:hypothetical protein